MFKNPFQRGTPEDVQTKQKGDLTAAQKAFQDAMAESVRKWHDVTDTEYWLCLCFQNAAQVDEFLRAVGLPKTERYLDGVKFARQLKIQINAPVGAVITTRVSREAKALAQGS